MVEDLLRRKAGGKVYFCLCGRKMMERVFRQNCWEFKKCCKDRDAAMAICPAITEVKANGVNGGKNGGRVCWAVAGTRCDGEVQGTYAQKVTKCSICDFRLKVKEEMSYKFTPIFF